MEYGATLGWVLIGAFIGFLAATKKGWSPIAGVLGGALLGCGAPLLFFVSSATGSDRTKACPKCAERIKWEAKLCRFCGTELGRTSSSASLNAGNSPVDFDHLSQYRAEEEAARVKPKPNSMGIPPSRFKE